MLLTEPLLERNHFGAAFLEHESRVDKVYRERFFPSAAALCSAVRSCVFLRESRNMIVPIDTSIASAISKH